MNNEQIQYIQEEIIRCERQLNDICLLTSKIQDDIEKQTDNILELEKRLEELDSECETMENELESLYAELEELEED